MGGTATAQEEDEEENPAQRHRPEQGEDGEAEHEQRDQQVQEEDDEEEHEQLGQQMHKEEERVVVVVGTGEERGHRAGGVWNPCKGRLLLVQIMSNSSGGACMLVTLTYHATCTPRPLLMSEFTNSKQSCHRAQKLTAHLDPT